MNTRASFILLLTCVLFSSAAFGQAVFQVASVPVTSVTITDQTAPTGEIAFSIVDGPSVEGKITINYGLPITYPDLSVRGSVAIRCYDYYHCCPN